jgi:hypothetical protein
MKTERGFGDVSYRSFRTASQFVPSSFRTALFVPLFGTKQSPLNHENVSLYVLMKYYACNRTVVEDMGNRRDCVS